MCARSACDDKSDILGRGRDRQQGIRIYVPQLGTSADARAVEILDVLLRDEVGHVAIGNRWYRWLCEREQLDPLTHYEVLAERHRAPRPRPPFNEPARRRAGFTEAELDALRRQGR